MNAFSAHSYGIPVAGAKVNSTSIEKLEALHFTKPRGSVAMRGYQDREPYLRTRLIYKFDQYSSLRSQGKYDEKQLHELLDDVERYQRLRPNPHQDPVTSFAALQRLIQVFPRRMHFDLKKLTDELVRERGCTCARCNGFTSRDKLRAKRKPDAEPYDRDPGSFELVCERCVSAEIPLAHPSRSARSSRSALPQESGEVLPWLSETPE